MSQNLTEERNHYTDKLALGTATLSGLYLLPVAAQAGIVNVDTPLTISIDDARAFDYQPVDWDVDGNSVADFRLEAFRTINYSSISSTYSGGGGYGWSIPNGRLELNGVDSANGMLGNADTKISNLAAGTPVGATPGAGLEWVSPVNDQVMSSSSYFGFPSGSLEDYINLVGFRFTGDGGQTLYGWAEIELDAITNLSMTIRRWAYEDSGAGIDIGQVSAVPAPPALLSMLSGLALGAGGVLRGRKLRKAAQDRETGRS